MAKRVAFSAILMALAVVSLFGASAAPSAKISLLALASVFGAVTVAEYGPKYGWIHYIGVSLLALLLLPKKLLAVLYLVFLGYYPMIKLYVERLDRRWLEWVLKLAIFTVLLVSVYFIFHAFFLPYTESAVVTLALRHLPWVALGLEALFVVYDLALSFIISYYYKVIQTKIHGG